MKDGVRKMVAKGLIEDMLRGNDENLARLGAILSSRLPSKEITSEIVEALLDAVGIGGVDILVPVLFSLSVISIKTDKVLPVLRKKIRNKNPDMREVIVNLIGWIGNPEDINLLWGGYKREKNVLVRTLIVDALGDIDREESVPFLLKIIQCDSEETVKEAGIEAIARIGEKAKQATTALITIIEEDPWAESAWMSAEALGRIKDSRAVPILIKAMYHESENLSECAVASLGEIGSEEAEQALSEGFKWAKNSLKEYIKNALELIRKRGGNR